MTDTLNGESFANARIGIDMDATTPTALATNVRLESFSIDEPRFLPCKCSSKYELKQELFLHLKSGTAF